MNNARRLLGTAILLYLCDLPLLPGAQSSLAGDWIGQIELGNRWQRFNLHIRTVPAGLEGTIDLPEQGRSGLPLKRVVQHATAVRVEWEGRSGPASYDGQIADDIVAGEFRQAGLKGTFHLLRVANTQSDLAVAAQYAGSYEVESNHFIDLAPFSEDEDRPIFFDSRTRRTGVLYALSENEFVTGPSYGVMFPISDRVTFLRDSRGSVSGLRWQKQGSAVQSATRVSPFREEEITFHNGDVTLKGTLTIPDTPGKHPAIILVHGSGPERRPGGHWTHFFARQGVAYFYFDKRGAGASTGDWNRASLEDLAGDVLAAVQALKGNPRLDPARIGLIGHSNGGWVAPLAASQTKDVAFLIVKSGSALSVADNILYELEMDMRAIGNFTEQEIAAAKSLRDQLNRALLTNTGWQPLMAAIEVSKNERWFQYARAQWLPTVPPPLDSDKNEVLNGLRKQIDFAPGPTWLKVHCPTLVLLGELDANTPSTTSARLIKSALTKSGNRDFAVRVLPKANHGLFEAVTGYGTESARLTRYVPGYMDGIAEWLLKRLKVDRGRLAR